MMHTREQSKSMQYRIKELCMYYIACTDRDAKNARLKQMTAGK